MPSPPTREQVDAWIQAGHITKEQGHALLADAGRPGRRTSDLLRLEPAPRWSDGKAPLLGLAIALLIAVASVTADTVAAAKTDLNVGDILDWAPAMFAASLLFVGLASQGPRREVLLAAAAGLGSLIAALHPNPEAWMYVVPAVIAVCVLLFHLEPATRMVAALPGLFGLLLVNGVLTSGSTLQSSLGVVVGGLYLLALWFLVPQASGWRRIPFLAHLSLAVLVLASVLVVILATVATNGISIPDRMPGESAGGLGSTLLTGAAILAYPAAVWSLWQSDRARSFTLPSLPLPHLVVPERRGEPA